MLINTSLFSIETAAGRPGAQPLHTLGRSDCHRHNILRRLYERNIQQRRQTATGFDLGARKVVVVRHSLAFVDLKPSE